MVWSDIYNTSNRQSYNKYPFFCSIKLSFLRFFKSQIKIKLKTVYLWCGSFAAFICVSIMLKTKIMRRISERAFILPALLLMLSSCASSSSMVDYSNQSTVWQKEGSLSERNYAANIERQRQINDELDMLSTMLSDSKRSKAKKALKQITELNSELAVLERQAQAYPAEIRNPQAKVGSTQAQDEEFKQEMARKADEKLRDMNLDQAVTKDSDPELQRAYQKYSSGGVVSSDQPAKNQDVFYAVQIGTGRPGKASSYHQVGQVRQTDNANGSAAYTVGSYNSLDQAHEACREIKSTTSYRDAFVVGFVHGRKVSVKEAQNYQR